ncbi:N-6 DNA methylase [Chryseobacterium indoltheticum]|uniref:N-6 DNA methylase n=1 Tax=Chryseobacterium indoltheticum TaxID=254 RepID=UPI001911BB96|nr:N-6 DNA methylase [Chryseobacterium indoltheticum]QQQ27725.1 N-6 DNA methylase [Chryseobacterium indoltheticum]
MMNFNRQHQSDLEIITSDIWNIFNVLRHENIKPEDYHIVLFFLSIYKDGLIDDEFFLRQDYPLNIWIDRQISNSDWSSYFELRDLYREVYSYFEPIINKISDYSLRYIFQTLFRLDYLTFSQNFPNIFDDILYKIAQAQGKSGGNFIQPLQLTFLMLNLADLKDYSKIYNPFAGLASFGVFLENEQKYFAQELNPETWALGKLRLHAHQKKNEKFLLQNSLEYWPNSTEKFDLIISNPPFGIKLSRFNHWGEYSSKQTIDEFLIREGIKSLSNEGKLIAVLPPKTLFSSGNDLQLRKFLIEEDLIDTIIALPGGLLLNSGMPLTIIFLNKAKKNFGKVKFIDAKNFVTNSDSRLKILNYVALTNFLNDEVVDNNIIRIVNAEEVRENDYNLNVPRYFKKEIEGVRLGDLIEIMPNRKTNLPDNGKLIRIRDLKDDNVDFLLDEYVLEYSSLKNNVQQIFETCLLMAVRWKTLKPTFFEYKGLPVFKSSDILAAKVDEFKVEKAYLINELQSEYVKQQLDSYRLGSTIPFIRQSDLLEVKIKLPSLEEQRAKVSGIIELSSKFKQFEIEKNNLLTGLKKNEIESSTSLSHILGKPLLSIGSSLEIIQSTLNKAYPSWKEVVISESRQFKMVDAFESISKNLKYIQELTDKNTSLMSISSFDLTEVNLLKFLSDFIKNERKSLPSNIELTLDIHDDIKQMTKQILILGNEQKLKIALINLIDNAKNHAFIDKEIDHEVNIEILPYIGNENEAYFLNYNIDSKKSYVEIRVSNTGKGFPKNFTLDDYVRKNFAVGKNANKGLGGYEVNEIVKAHNEGRKALSIFSFTEDQKFSSTISFLIPMI